MEPTSYLIIALIVACVGVAAALVLLDNKINKEAREKLPRMTQNLIDVLDAWKNTDDQLWQLGRDTLMGLQRGAEELIDYGENLYKETYERVVSLRNRVKRLLEG